MHECQNRAHEATRRARAHDRHVSRGRHRARGDFDRGAAGAASSSEKAETALRRRAVDLQAGVRTTGTWPGPRFGPRPGPGAPGSGLGRARPGPRPGPRPRRPDPDWPRVRGKALRPGPRKRGTSAGARPEPGPRRPGPGPARVRGSAMGLGPGPSQGPGQGRSPGPVRARAPADESWCLGGPGPGPAPRDAASRRLPQYGILPGAGHHGCEAGHRQVPPGAWVQPGAGHRELHLLRALAGAVPMKGRQWSASWPQSWLLVGLMWSPSVVVGPHSQASGGSYVSFRARATRAGTEAMISASARVLHLDMSEVCGPVCLAERWHKAEFFCGPAPPGPGPMARP